MWHAGEALCNLIDRDTLPFKMPIIQSAKKAVRQSVRRRDHNAHYRHALKETLQNVRRFVAQGNVEEAMKSLPALYKILDKSVKENVMKKNTVARYKSRIAKKIANLQTAKS
jgi:small subunit ribosomal protein S20